MIETPVTVLDFGTLKKLVTSSSSAVSSLVGAEGYLLSAAERRRFFIGLL